MYSREGGEEGGEREWEGGEEGGEREWEGGGGKRGEREKEERNLSGCSSWNQVVILLARNGIPWHAISCWPRSQAVRKKGLGTRPAAALSFSHASQDGDCSSVVA